MEFKKENFRRALFDIVLALDFGQMLAAHPAGAERHCKPDFTVESMANSCNSLASIAQLLTLE